MCFHRSGNLTNIATPKAAEGDAQQKQSLKGGGPHI